MKSRRMAFAGITGVGSAFCLVAGKELDVYYTLNLTDPGFYVKWLLCSLLCALMIYGIWTLVARKDKGNILQAAWLEKLAVVESKMKPWMIVVFLMLMWLPTWLSIFPGAFSYDAYDEWQQVASGQITAHHPVLHVLWLGGLTEGLYQLTGSYNVGIAVYVLMQMLILAGTFAYTILFMREQRVPPLCRLFGILFYGCSPVVGLFAVCGTKDTIFAAAFLLFMISLWRIAFERAAFFQKKSRQVLFCVSALGSMIMRNNGFYVVVLMLLLVLVVCWKDIKKYLVLLTIIGMAYVFYAGPFYSMLHVAPGGVQEMLSVPLQQLARVYHYDRTSFSTEDLEYMHAIVPVENWEQYRSTVADFVKSGFRQEVYEEDTAGFWKLWLKTGMKNPLTYINSFLLGVVDYWYPFAIVDGYQDVYGAGSYFDYKVSPPGKECIILPGLHELYEKISFDKETQKLPGLFLVCSPGWYLLLFLQLFMYLWYQKAYLQMLPLLAVLLYFGTLLLGPIALVRYVLILYFAFPVYSVFVNAKVQQRNRANLADS